MLITIDSPVITASFDASPEATIALACIVVAYLLVRLAMTWIGRTQPTA